MRDRKVGVMIARAEITDAAIGERAEYVMRNKGPHLWQLPVPDDTLCQRKRTKARTAHDCACLVYHVERSIFAQLCQGRLSTKQELDWFGNGGNGR